MSTVSQVLESSVEEFLNYSSTFSGHTANKTNPHDVTKEQVGLDNVTNVEQASKSEYDSHVAGTADRHNIESILYDSNYNLKEYLANLILNSSGGTMDHSLLMNRDISDAHPVTAISGLNDLLGHTYTFIGTTVNSTETEIFTNDTGPFIDEVGRIRVPPGTALAIDFKLIYGVEVGSLERFYTTRYITQTATVTRTASTVTALRTSAAVIAGEDTLTGTSFSITANHAKTDMGDGSLSLKVVGLANTLYWKAVFRVMPITMSEFLV